MMDVKICLQFRGLKNSGRRREKKKKRGKVCMMGDSIQMPQRLRQSVLGEPVQERSCARRANSTNWVWPATCRTQPTDQPDLCHSATGVSPVLQPPIRL
ncbi:hypothetical protein VTN96DRAFT_2479 [Rasamsonia emersonii]